MRHRWGWSAQGRARRPRLHDARHTFAVSRLVRWYEEGADVGQKPLALSTYLGHAKVTDAYWHLTGVPELMAIASRRFEYLARAPQEARHSRHCCRISFSVAWLPSGGRAHTRLPATATRISQVELAAGADLHA